MRDGNIGIDGLINNNAFDINSTSMRKGGN